MLVRTQRIQQGEAIANIEFAQRWVCVTVLHKAGADPFSDESLSQAISALEPRVQRKMHWHIEQVGDQVFRHCVLPIEQHPAPLLYVAFCSHGGYSPTTEAVNDIEHLRDLIEEPFSFRLDASIKRGIEALLRTYNRPPRRVPGTLQNGGGFRTLEAAKNAVASELRVLPDSVRWGLILEVWKDGSVAPIHLMDGSSSDASEWRWERPE